MTRDAMGRICGPCRQCMAERDVARAVLDESLIKIDGLRRLLTNAEQLRAVYQKNSWEKGQRIERLEAVLREVRDVLLRPVVEDCDVEQLVASIDAEIGADM